MTAAHQGCCQATGRHTLLARLNAGARFRRPPPHTHHMPVLIVCESASLSAGYTSGQSHAGLQSPPRLPMRSVGFEGPPQASASTLPRSA